MSLLRFQKALVDLYTGGQSSTTGLTASERRALSLLDKAAVARYAHGLKLKRRSTRK